MTCQLIKSRLFRDMSDQSPTPSSNSKPASPVVPSNSFSVMSLLSGKHKAEDPTSTLIKPIPMLGTPTNSERNTTAFTFPPHCAAFLPSGTPQMPTTPINQITPHPMAIMNAMAALNRGMVDPTTLLMLQSLAVARSQAALACPTLMAPPKPAGGSPSEMNVSNSSSPQCLMPNASFSNWLTPSTEMSSSSSSGNTA